MDVSKHEMNGDEHEMTAAADEASSADLKVTGGERDTSWSAMNDFLGVVHIKKRQKIYRLP